MAEFSRQNYDRAIAGLRAFITRYPGDARAAEARLRLGDAYVAQQHYAQAVLEYQTLLRQFPGSPLIPTALYQLGQARLASGDQGGCQDLRAMVEQHPNAREAASARAAISARCPASSP
jgi:TolA-binding protein